MRAKPGREVVASTSANHNGHVPCARSVATVVLWTGHEALLTHRKLLPEQVKSQNIVNND